MSMTSAEFFSDLPIPVDIERRCGSDRRVKKDQRASIRFDKNGGDRRSEAGRRSSDEIFEVLE